MNNLSELTKLVSHIKLPRMIEVRQSFPRPVLKDVPEAVCKSVKDAGVLNRIKPGDTVAITAGSRGISNVNIVIKEIVDMCESARKIQLFRFSEKPT